MLDVLGERIQARGVPLIPPFWPMHLQPAYGAKWDGPRKRAALAAQQASDRQLASLILLPGVTTARNADGRGQGLKIVRDQAKRLGGTIKVASKRGRFLRFSVDFHPKE